LYDFIRSDIKLPDGIYAPGTVQVKYLDLAGNASPVFSNESTIVIDTVAPSTIGAILKEDTGISQLDRITSNNTLMVVGLGGSGSSFHYSYDYGVTWYAGLGSSFNIPAGAYANGQVKVKQVDAAGNSSTASDVPAFEIQNSKLLTPRISLYADDGSLPSDGLTSIGLLNINNIERDSLLEISIDFGGTWTRVTDSFTLPNGVYQSAQVQVRQSNIAGNLSDVYKHEQQLSIVPIFNLSNQYYKNLDGQDFKYIDFDYQQGLFNPFAALSVKIKAGTVSFRSNTNYLNNGKPTYVYCHGWQDSSTSPGSNVLYEKMLRRLGNSANIVFVDWSGLAKIKTGPTPPQEECSETDQVGQIVADALYKSGVNINDLSLIGHSLGSYVMAATSKYLQNNGPGKPLSYTALDPAYTPYPYGYILDARKGTSIESFNPFKLLSFSDLAKESYSYTVSDLAGGVASIAGDNTKASSADNAYIVQYLEQPMMNYNYSNWIDVAKTLFDETQKAAISTSYHNGVIGVYADLFLKDRLKAPSASEKSYWNGMDFLFNVEQRNAYDNKGLGFLDSDVDIYNKNFDGVILAPEPWIGDNANDRNEGGGRRVPSSIGWISGDPGMDGRLIAGSKYDDIMFYNYIYENNEGKGPLANTYINGGKGNDTIVGDFGRVVVDAFYGDDTIVFGYSRNGVNEKACDDGEGWIGDGGLGSYIVIDNFGYSADSNGYDKILLPWSRGEIDFKLGKDYAWGAPSKVYGDGIAVFRQNRILGIPNYADLLAYIPGCTYDSFKWCIDQGFVQFDTGYSLNYDTSLLA
jgi:hypothetical protein